MKKHFKRWLMSRMKTSGSEHRYVVNERYADERYKWKNTDIDALPIIESIKSSYKFYNGKINYGILVRFLRGRIGKDWNDVYSEIINRIPIKLLDYKEMIFWFVANDVEITSEGLWNKKSQKFIWTNGLFESKDIADKWHRLQFIEFYVDPKTNLLMHIPQKSVIKAINHRS
ncbi:hypothetical protein [Hymenobacter crusticola]|uniref:hypothetical protein n=1 Tax=Hymenobacter crusticola TaxID=1770526 RepID=UPI00117A2D5C|nr:hypothetical protein [Hymenobacter crusticola]